MFKVPGTGLQDLPEFRPRPVSLAGQQLFGEARDSGYANRGVESDYHRCIGV